MYPMQDVAYLALISAYCARGLQLALYVHQASTLIITHVHDAQYLTALAVNPSLGLTTALSA